MSLFLIRDVLSGEYLDQNTVMFVADPEKARAKFNSRQAAEKKIAFVVKENTRFNRYYDYERNPVQFEPVEFRLVEVTHE
jgi:hypothetical protein